MDSNKLLETRLTNSNMLSFKQISSKVRMIASFLFKRHPNSQGCTVVLIYVDDMIISSQNSSYAHFNMKDLGSPTYFLGLEISRTHGGIHVHQRKYAEDLIKAAHLKDARTFDTPLELNAKTIKDDRCPLKDSAVFCRLVGNLLT